MKDQITKYLNQLLNASYKDASETLNLLVKQKVSAKFKQHLSEKFENLPTLNNRHYIVLSDTTGQYQTGQVLPLSALADFLKAQWKQYNISTGTVGVKKVIDGQEHKIELRIR